MGVPVFSQIYEQLWRPVFTRGFSLGGSSTVDYDRALRAYLARTGDRMVLDVACGAGGTTRDRTLNTVRRIAARPAPLA